MKKKLIVVLCIVGVVICGLCGFAGNYLVNYALVIDNQGRLGSMGSEIYEGHQDTQAQKDYDQWITTQVTEEWTIESQDHLKLWGQYYKGDEDSHIYVLAVHGYTVDHRDIAPAIKPFVEKGYHVLTIDQRGRGHSEGHYLSMGYLEKNDVVLWAQRICQQDHEAKIILYGESMGAATVMMAAGDTILSKNVVAVVEDCGYTSAYDMFKDQLKERFGLPEFPFLISADIVGRMRLGFHFYDANVLKQLKTSSLPILFIHGGADDYVPTYMGKELYNSYHGEKELLIVDGAGHGQSADVNPQLYYQTVFDFISKYTV